MSRYLPASLLIPVALCAAPVLSAAELAVPTGAKAEVRAAEQGFADAFARRDQEAFAGFIAADAVFLGTGEPLRGRKAILEVWAGRYFEGDRPPFSWRPAEVAVAGEGDVAISTGPVYDPDGTWAGTFVSTWRRGSDGRWRVVLDLAPRCSAPPAEPAGP